MIKNNGSKQPLWGFIISPQSGLIIKPPDVSLFG